MRRIFTIIISISFLLFAAYRESVLFAKDVPEVIYTIKSACLLKDGFYKWDLLWDLSLNWWDISSEDTMYWFYKNTQAWSSSLFFVTFSQTWSNYVEFRCNSSELTDAIYTFNLSGISNRDTDMRTIYISKVTKDYIIIENYWKGIKKSWEHETLILLRQKKMSESWMATFRGIYIDDSILLKIHEISSLVGKNNTLQKWKLISYNNKKNEIQVLVIGNWGKRFIFVLEWPKDLSQNELKFIRRVWVK